MFAPPVAKPKAKTAAPLKDTSPLNRAAPFGHRQIDGGAEYLRMLQQSIGNQAVLRLLRRQGLIENKHGDPGQDIGPESVSAEGGSRGLAWDFSKIRRFPPERMSGEFQSPSQFPAPRLPGPIQAKLKVGAVDDPLEHEADRVAEQVMHMLAPDVSVASALPQVSRKCVACEEEEEKLQKKPAGPQGAAGEVPGIVHEVLSSPGQPLDTATRGYFEPRFGHDFSRTRVHSGAQAATSAEKINAVAYTSGQHVVFGEGRYAPETSEGRRLLAHELVHVVQQRSGASPIIARQESTFREKWSVVWHVGALAGYRAKKLAAEALEAARQTGLPGLHNGPADAWRHCYWNCRMTAVIGKDDAAFIAENHEEQDEHNPTAERMMDTWNNKEGRDCAEPEPVAGSGANPKDDYADWAAKAAQKRPAVDCDSSCQQKLDAGKLWTLEDLGGGNWGGKVQISKPTPRAGTPSGEKYKRY
jgi:hypothetical protein